jgi:outer membrane protein TolC
VSRLPLTAALLLLGAAVAPAASGGEARPISLDEALRLSFEKSPDVQQAREAVAGQAANVQERSGSFDLLMRVQPSWSHVESELSTNSRLNEERRRIQLEETAKAFRELKEAYADAIARRTEGAPLCPGGFTTISVSQLVGSVPEDSEGIPSVLCVPLGVIAPADLVNGPLPRNSDAINAAIIQGENLGNVVDSYILPGGGPSSSNLDFEARLNEIYALGLEDRIEDVRQRGYEILEQGLRLAEEAELRATFALERLGPIPPDEYRRQLGLRIDFSKPLRLGTVISLQFSTTGTESNFRGRPLDPAFGGKGVQNEWRSGGSLIIDQPLGRGRGKVSAAAPERTAKADLQAAKLTYQHTVTTQALNTTLAYIDLMASQQSLELLERSVESNRQIRDATRELVKAGERAGSELDRAEARLSDTEASVVNARNQVLQARTQLAVVSGLGPGDVAGGLLASQRLPAQAALPELDAVARNARSMRYDLRSAEATERGSDILFQAARADLKRRLDLQVRFGAGSFYQGPYFRVLKDEQVRNPFEPTETPLNYYNPSGFGRALGDHWAPTFSVSLRFELPFGNRAATGRMIQAQQVLRQDSIRTANLSRVIEENVAQLLGAVKRAAAEVQSRVRAVEAQEATWRTAQQLRAAGELTLIDLITTEQNLTSARLSLVQSQRDFDSNLARLRFETGTLVRFRDGEPQTVETAGLVGD